MYLRMHNINILNKQLPVSEVTLPEEYKGRITLVKAINEEYHLKFPEHTAESFILRKHERMQFIYSTSYVRSCKLEDIVHFLNSNEVLKERYGECLGMYHYPESKVLYLITPHDVGEHLHTIIFYT